MTTACKICAPALGLIVLLAGAGPLSADPFPLDRVVLTLGAGGGQTVLSGRVLDYTGAELKFQDGATMAVRSYPSSRVQSIETPQTDPHRRGLKAFDDNRIADALAEFQKALAEEPRIWVKREIVAQQLRCALRKGDYHSAATRFETLIESDPSTMYYRLIPLIWTPEPQPSRLVDAANEWIKDNDEPMQLIGASVLLSTPQYEKIARGVLRGLMASIDERVYGPAEAQLWRMRLGADNLDSGDVNRWLPRLEKIPAELRGGPTFVVGQAYFRVQQYEQAAAMLLWVPLAYDDDYHLAARACFVAAEGLSRIGQTHESATLYRELTQRFGESPYALEAVRRLEGAAAGERMQGETPEAD